MKVDEISQIEFFEVGWRYFLGISNDFKLIEFSSTKSIKLYELDDYNITSGVICTIPISENRPLEIKYLKEELREIWNYLISNSKLEYSSEKDRYQSQREKLNQFYRSMIRDHKIDQIIKEKV